jgi:hypothetical protein
VEGLTVVDEVGDSDDSSDETESHKAEDSLVSRTECCESPEMMLARNGYSTQWAKLVALGVTVSHRKSHHGAVGLKVFSTTFMYPCVTM